MSVRHLLRELRTRGIEYRIGSAPDKLWFGPQDKVTPGLLDDIVTHKEAILTILKAEELDWQDLEERAALIDEHRLIGMTQAYKQLIGGPTAVIDRWRQLIKQMTPRTDIATWLKKAALSFLSTDELRSTPAIGWSELEVWGLHPLAVRTRIDCHGLFMTAASWPDQPIRLLKVEHDYAILATGRHPEIAVPRMVFASDCVPVWEAGAAVPGPLN